MLRERIEEREREYEVVFGRMFKRAGGYYELIGGTNELIVNVYPSEYERAREIFVNSLGASGIILIDAVVYVDRTFMEKTPNVFVFMEGKEPKQYNKNIDVNKYSDSKEGDYIRFPNTLVYITDKENSLIGYVPIHTLKTGFNSSPFGIDFIHIFPVNGGMK